jgi:hypothetical protein
VKEETGDWSYFTLPCIEEFQATYPDRMDNDYYQQVYQCININILMYSDKIAVLPGGGGKFGGLVLKGPMSIHILLF